MKLHNLLKQQTLEEQAQSSSNNLAIYTKSIEKLTTILEKINHLGKEKEGTPEMIQLRNQLNESRRELLKQARVA